jgi:hypothetical protein
VQRLAKTSDVADIKAIMQRCGNQLHNVDLSLVDLYSALETHITVANAFSKDVQENLSAKCAEIINAQGDLTEGVLGAVEHTRSTALQSLKAISDHLEVLQRKHHDSTQDLQGLLTDQQISTLGCQFHLSSIEEVLQRMGQEVLQNHYALAMNWLTLLQTAGSVIGALTGVAGLRAQYKSPGNDTT